MDAAVADIGRRSARKDITRRRGKVRPKAVNRELGNLRAVFERAVKIHKLLKENPFAHLEMLQEDPLRGGLAQ